MDAISKFLEVSSDVGYGYGYGCGNGNAFSSGYIIGNGDGYGMGSGYGYSNASGYGYGYGKGQGRGDCSGSDSGYGFGSDSGDIKSFNGNKVYVIDKVDTIIESVHGNYAKGFILNADLTLTPTYIARVGNSFAHGETLHKALEDATDKDLQQRPLEERIDDFVKQHPKGHKFPASEYSKWHHILAGSCEQGRKSFMSNRGIEEDALYTPEEFINITSEAYGSDVIKELSKRY